MHTNATSSLHIGPTLHHVLSIRICACNLALGKHSRSGMRSAPSQYGTYYGAASVSQNSSNVQPPQPPTGPLAGTQVSRVGSRKSSASNRPHAQAPQARGVETPSAEVTPTPDVLAYSNLTHRVRTTLSGPGAGSSGASPSHSPDQQGLPRSARLDEEPERGRRMSGIKGVLDRHERRPSMVSPSPGSKPVSKDPYTRRESMDIPSPNGKSPSYAKTNGVSIPCRARVAVSPSMGKPPTDVFFPGCGELQNTAG